MNKNTIFYFALLNFLLPFFQAISLTAFSQVKFDWTRPFSQCWSFKSNQVIGNRVASDNTNPEIIVIPNFSGSLIALSGKSGEVLWNTEFGGDLISEPIFYNKDLYLLTKTAVTETLNPMVEGSVNGFTFLRSMDASTGLTKSEKTFPPVKQIFSLEKNKILFLYEDGTGAVVGLESGGILLEIEGREWSFQISSASLSDNVLLIGTSGNKVFLISARDGRLLRSVDIGGAPKNVFLDKRQRLLWADSRGSVSMLDLKKNKILWRRRNGAALLSIADTLRGLLVSSLDNFVYLLDRRNGNIIWKRRFGNKLVDEPLVKDDIAIVVQSEDASASFINIKNGKLVNTIKLSDANLFLAKPLLFNNNLIFTTGSGVFSFASSGCLNK